MPFGDTARQAAKGSKNSYDTRLEAIALARPIAIAFGLRKARLCPLASFAQRQPVYGTVKNGGGQKQKLSWARSMGMKLMHTHHTI